MPTPKKKQAPGGTTKPKASSAREVVVRMYNVGFGDAFLVRISDGTGERKILFDCGSIEAADGIPMKSIVDRIFQDATDSDGVARIDVVVTHRHKDHVSGFGQAAWQQVHVQEVWMPWTEHPTDPAARKIRDVQARLALGLQAALAARSGTVGPNEKRYQDIVANALMLSNDKAMKTLRGGFVGNPLRRFLPAKSGTDGDRTLETGVLPGVKVHVLGPSRDPDVIRDMDPPSGESYLRMNGAWTNGAAASPAPFPREFRQDTASSGVILAPNDLDRIHRAGSLSDLAVAVALDKAVNGTSLMLVLEVAGTFLLFPGDAQWGTWNAVLKDPQWKDMLTRVAFYKIGHHGSHNATPKDFVEDMVPDGICAMASTLTRQVWPDIPKPDLLTALATHKATVARSDRETEAGPNFRADKGGIEARIAL